MDEETDFRVYRRSTTGLSLVCPTHGDVSADYLVIGHRPFCGRCAAEKSGFKPWFYTNSLHGRDIVALGLSPLAWKTA